MAEGVTPTFSSSAAGGKTPESFQYSPFGSELLSSKTIAETPGPFRATVVCGRSAALTEPFFG
jgi:hypothetical protein